MKKITAFFVFSQKRCFESGVRKNFSQKNNLDKKKLTEKYLYLVGGKSHQRKV